MQKISNLNYQIMKAVYICLLVVGIVLLLATESESGLSNIIGLAASALAGYKLGIFDQEDTAAAADQIKK